MLLDEEKINIVTIKHFNNFDYDINISLKHVFVEFELNYPFVIKSRFDLSKTELIALIKCILETFKIENENE